MKSIGILSIIDDDDIYQFVTRKMVERNNLANKTLSFGNGEMAITFFNDKLTENKPDELPDVILLDINMPLMDGWQFLEQYHRIKSAIKKPIHIYMVSSSVNEEDIERAKSIDEVCDYIIKPISKGNIAEISARL